jgi:hypothetical protein
MSAIKRLALAIALIGLVSACAAPTKYEWGNYESALKEHYETPGNSAEFALSLQESITIAETGGKVVPPGLYAEYGKVLLDAGDSTQARSFFERERAQWPESQVLMDAMIRLAAEKQGGQP